MRHLTKEEEKRFRRECFGMDVFAMVHSTLKSEQGNTTDYSPTEIWVAATAVSKDLMEMELPEEQIDYTMEQLYEECDSEWDAFLVLLVSSFQIAPYRKKLPEKTDLIESLLMKELRKNERFRELMESISRREVILKRKIDLLAYELKDVGQNGGDDKAVRDVLKIFISGAKGTSDASMEHNLLVFCYVNLMLNHKYDDMEKELFTELGLKTEFHPTTKIVNGDENNFEAGAAQENFRVSANTDFERLLSVVQQKQLK